MNVFWINMRAHKKRRQFMLEQFKRLPNLKPQRIDAVTPETLPNVLLRKQSKGIQKTFKKHYRQKQKKIVRTKPGLRHRGRIYTKPALACTCSHLKAMQCAFKMSSEWVAIMEDDVKFVYRIDWPKLIATAPPQAEILQLHVSKSRKIAELYRNGKQGQLWVPWDRHCTSTGMYLIKRSAIAKILKRYVRNNNIVNFKSASLLVADRFIYNACQTYTLTIPIFLSETRFGSSIHPSHIKRHNEAVTVGKNLINIHANTQNLPFFIHKI